MDGLAMLREIIAQLRNLFELPASSPDLRLLHLHQPQNLHQILHLPSHQPLIVHPHHATSTTTTICVSSAMEAATGEWWCSGRTNEQPNQQAAAAATLSSSPSSSVESLPPSSSSSSSSSTLHPYKKQRGSDTKASCSTTMEEEIWKHLPEDLIQKVKSHLPIPALFRSRLVSQKWNSTEPPPRTNRPPPHKETWVYAVTGMDNTPRGWLYEPSSKKWRLRTIPNFKAPIPVASASGLVCFLNRDDNRVHVCNPLTGKWRRLNISGGRLACPVAFGMYSMKGEEYCVIWVGGDGRLGVYESGEEGRRRRKMVGGENVSIPVWMGVRSGSVRVGGEVYFLRRGPEGVVSYNVERGEWREHLIPAPPNVTDRALVVKAAGGGEGEEEGLLLVGLQKKNAATCVCVWELQRMCYLWKEVDRMPNLWCLDFYGKNVSMVCLANSSLILLSLTSASTHRLVSYDTVASLWSHLPSPSSPSSPFTSGAAFRPSPSALP